MEVSRPVPIASSATPWRLLLLLMAMTAIGPTSLNIVVPAVPNLASRLATDVDTIQLTVSLFILGLAFAQLLLGPLSDRFGRRPVVLAGLSVTVAASLAAMAAETVGRLIVARMLQAIGASTGIVIGRAMIRDLFDRDRAAAMLGLVATAMVVAPMIGPLIGGMLDTVFGWESIFMFMAAAGLAVLAWAAMSLPETTQSRRRARTAISPTSSVCSEAAASSATCCAARSAPARSSRFSAAGRT